MNLGICLFLVIFLRPPVLNFRNLPPCPPTGGIGCFQVDLFESIPCYIFDFVTTCNLEGVFLQMITSIFQTEARNSTLQFVWIHISVTKLNALKYTAWDHYQIILDNIPDEKLESKKLKPEAKTDYWKSVKKPSYFGNNNNCQYRWLVLVQGDVCALFGPLNLKLHQRCCIS